MKKFKDILAEEKMITIYDTDGKDLSFVYNLSIGLDKQGIMRKANLSNQIIKNAKLTKNDFQHASFENSKLKNANFIKSDLRWSNFNNTDLTGANFENVDLRYATFQDAILKKVNFKGANLIGVDLFDADISGANFKNSKRDEYLFDDVKNLDKAKNI